MAALIENMKNYTLIIGHDFSISNDTDSDPNTDYRPGIWAIGSQKSALHYAREILAKGDRITVSDYDRPQYHVLANKFIKALGLKQKLFPEPKALEQKAVTNGKPSNLSELKRYLGIGRKVKITNYDTGGAVREARDTSVIGTQTNAVIFDRNGKKSWLEFGKAGEWTFDNDGAIKFIHRDDGLTPSSRIEYQN